MPDIDAPDQVGSRRLDCLIEGEFEVFSVTAELDFEVIDLKKKIKEEAVHGTLKDVDSYILELWKVSAIDESLCEVTSPFSAQRLQPYRYGASRRSE